MEDFPTKEFIDEKLCYEWLTNHLHPLGLKCPRCGSKKRRLAKRNSAISAFRCKECDCYHTIFTGTVLAKTRQPASKLVRLLLGVYKGEPVLKLSRELGLSRKQTHTLRKRIQDNLLQPLSDSIANIETLMATSL
jgi:transposase-like protein